MPDSDMPVDLLPDGRVRLMHDKATITLRRPLIGELRSLHESLEDTNESVRSILLALPPAPDRPSMGDGGEEAQAALAEYQQRRQERRDAERKALSEVDDLRADWMRQAVSTLGDKPLRDVPTAELPTWAASTEVAVALVNHWQSVPLVRGGR